VVGGSPLTPPYPGQLFSWGRSASVLTRSTTVFFLAVLNSDLNLEGSSGRKSRGFWSDVSVLRGDLNEDERVERDINQSEVSER
jgi:hypothetical protein